MCRRPGGTGGRRGRVGWPGGVGSASRHAGVGGDRSSGVQLWQLPGRSGAARRTGTADHRAVHDDQPADRPVQHELGSGNWSGSGVKLGARWRPGVGMDRTRQDGELWLVRRNGKDDRMRGTVLVLDSSYFQKTDSAGHYRLEHLPTGHFTVKAWINESDVRVRAVDLKEGARLHLDFPAK